MVFSTFTQRNSCLSNGLLGSVTALVRHDGFIYAATSVGVFRLNPPSEANQYLSADFEQIQFFNNMRANDLLSFDESLIIATDNCAYYYNNKSAIRVFEGRVQKLHRSKIDPNRVFIFTENGLASIYVTNNSWINEGYIPGVRGLPTSIAEDGEGSLWIGTKLNGIAYAKYDKSGNTLLDVTFFNLDNSKGLMSNEDNKVFYIQGRVFFALNQVGLCYFNIANRNFIRYTDFGEDFSNAKLSIENIVEDEKGFVYISVIEAIFSDKKRSGHAIIKQINLSTVKKIDSDIRTRKNSNVYSEVYRIGRDTNGKIIVDRMPFDRFVGNKFELIVSSGKVLWVGASDFVLRFDGNAVKNFAQPYRAIIGRVSLNSVEDLFGGLFVDSNGVFVDEQPESMIRTLDYVRGNTFRFHCAAASYDEPRLTEFQYLLEGNDNKWSDWTHEPFKEYTNLLEGTYRFRVRARNAHLQVSEEAVYEFHIRPPIYRTVWAWLLYTLLGVGLLYSIYQYRHQALIAEKNKLDRQVKDRTFELAMEKDKTEVQNQLLHNKNQELENKNRKLEENEVELTRQRNQLSFRNFMLQEQAGKLERQKNEIETQKEELEHQKEELEQKNRQLIVERAEKLQAQKMAGLGEITSIVAHEINTPLSSIIGSLNNVQQSLASVIQELPAQVATLNEASLTEFWSLIEIYRSNPPTLTSREERGQQRTLEAWFEGLGYDRPEDAALQVVRVGIGGRAQEFESLFALAREQEDLFELIVRLGSTWRQLFAMNASADRAKLIVTSLQSYVKQADDEGKAVPTNVLETLRLVLTLYDYYISRGIELKLDLADDLPLIEGYPHLLKQAWTNLIMSSVYAMNFKGVLEISAESDEGGITLTLRDSGPQIAPDRLEQLFKAEANARETSPPVSLWICYNVFVEQHGGEIKVNSDGEHTTYAIRLPLS